MTPNCPHRNTVLYSLVAVRTSSLEFVHLWPCSQLVLPPWPLWVQRQPQGQALCRAGAAQVSPPGKYRKATTHGLGVGLFSPPSFQLWLPRWAPPSPICMIRFRPFSQQLFPESNGHNLHTGMYFSSLIGLALSSCLLLWSSRIPSSFPLLSTVSSYPRFYFLWLSYP